ncbi:asparagine synthetase B family protein [Methanofollis tationis]|uniref:hypothetical protein n=1 Tax=Methanofollis tationis TaxID=81417 RepID=UPI0031B58EAA
MERNDTWKRYAVTDGLCITAHPDLPVTVAENGDRKLLLLGYMLDPYHPDLDDDAILNGILGEITRPADIFQRTATLGGRWALIYADPDEIWLMNDPMGLRQVVHTNGALPDLWCASQPGTIAEELGLDPDPEVMERLVGAPEYREALEYWWPGDLSPYSGIKHLLPNRYLDLKRRSVHRFWPDQRLERIRAEECVEKCATVLKGMIESASKRFDLAHTVTAGWDSRTALSACKAVSPEIFYFTMIYYNKTAKTPDISVARDLIARLGLEHHLILCPDSMDPEFAEIYRKNVWGAHEGWGAIARGMYDHYPQERVCIKGNGSGMLKCRYRQGWDQACTGELLADLADIGPMNSNRMTIEHFERWISEAQEVSARSGIHILDLFYQEQRMARRQGMSQLEWDIVQEVLVPWNSRELIAAGFSVEGRCRGSRHPLIQHGIIRALWPEVISVPVNPPPGIKGVAAALLWQVGLWPFDRAF